MRLSAVILILFSLLPTAAPASPGSLDTTFNNPYGYALFNSTANGRDRGVETAIQADGKIVVLGYSYNGSNEDVLLVRFTADGKLDAGFGSGGYVLYNGGGNDRGLALALQADGKIVAAGYTYVGTHRDVLVLRYKSDGILDTTFGTGGVVTYSSSGAATDIGFGVTIQTDGRIVVVGEISNGTNQDALVLRYTSAGTLDGSFGAGGVFTYAGPGNTDRAFAAAIQSDGKIVVAGASVVNSKDDVLVFRLNGNGTLDGSFGAGGVVTYSGSGDYFDYGNAVAIREDGRIVVLGATSNGSAFDVLLLQYTTGGVLDGTFGSGGVAVYGDGGGLNEYGYGLVIQTDGKIVVAGYTQGTNDDVLVVRFMPGGTLDSTFGSGGAVVWSGSGGGTDYGQAVAVQSDGKLVIAGFSHNGVNEDLLVMRLWGSDAVADLKCFIATAAYGSYLDPHVIVLRKFRDEHLMTNRIGRQLTMLYYAYSPPIADFIEYHAFLKPLVRGLLAPIILAVMYPAAAFAILGIPLGVVLIRRKTNERR